jgi:endoglycosylceramidase
MKLYFRTEKKYIAFFLLIFSLYFSTGCNFHEGNRKENFYQCGRFICRGDYKILLRGVNISHTAKRTIIPWVGENEIKILREKWGLNFIRLTVFWAAVEPERDKYNRNYINSLKEIIEIARKYEIYVLVDSHQDIFGFRATDSDEGDGPPEWARDETCPEFQNLKPWMLNYISPAIMCQFDSFWQDKNGVQTSYIKMLGFLAKEFDEYENIIGFEIMNEPWPGTSFLNTEKWENETLREFYKKAINEIRKFSNKLIFYETHPLSDFGWNFYLVKPEGENLVYAPHIYPLPDELMGVSGINKGLKEVFLMHLEHSLKYDVPMIIGEYGSSWEDEKAYDKIMEHINLFDSNFVGSAIWAYDKASKYSLGIVDDFLNPMTNFLPVIRPYPELVKGTMQKLEYHYHPDGEKEMEFILDGEEFILSCPKIFRCYINGEEIKDMKITQKEGKIKWE